MLKTSHKRIPGTCYRLVTTASFFRRVSFLVACLLLPACTQITDFFDRIGEDDDDAPADAVLVWSDEFDGAKLDTTKWRHRSLGPRRDATNVRSAVALDGDGHLIIATSRKDDKIQTGMIGTRETFLHKFGYWEARLRFQKQEGHWSAFWLQSPTIGEVGDPAVNGVEIDIIEWMTNKHNLVIHNLHWNGYGPEHQSTGRRVPFFGLSEGFHTVAVDWTPDAYTFYVDGHKTWHTTAAISRRAQYAILSLEVGEWAGDIDNALLPDSLIVDYVRVYDRKPDRRTE